MNIERIGLREQEQSHGTMHVPERGEAEKWRLPKPKQCKKCGKNLGLLKFQNLDGYCSVHYDS